MRALLAALLFCLASTLQAQSIPFSPYTPVQPNRTPLAESAEVPFALLLGLDGATPLFVNPARAARSKNRFVYGTVHPVGAPNAVSFAALLGTRRSRWLVVAENVIYTQDYTSSDLTNQEFDRGDIISLRNVDRTNRRTIQNLGTRGRLLRVGRTDFGGYAFGLFAGYGRESLVYESDAEYISRDLRTEPNSNVFEVEEQNFTEDETTGIAYGLGAEFALAGQKWDLAAAASYQGSEVLRTAEHSFLNVSESETTVSPTEIYTRLTEREMASEARTDASPQGFGLDLVGTLQAGASRDDYLFTAASGAMLSGTGTYLLDYFERQFSRVDDNGSVTEDVVVDEREAAGEDDVTMRVLRLSLGYIYARKGRGAQVLAGVVPTAGFARVESLDASQIDVRRIYTDVTVLGLQLPLHVHLPVKRSLALFGGGVYSYEHFEVEQAAESIPLDDAGDLIVIDQQRVDNTTTFVSGGRLYGGAILSLRSGLTAQAAFRGDLANFEQWTVSLGYRF